MLNFETRGQKTANNKPNIYFACYPDDKKIYYDSIADEIWNIQNCAIFYEEDYSAPFDAEELERKIKSMQLVVMPVTDRLLRHPSRAIDFELKCAIGNHVPVLPLMQEEVQIEMYEKHFGKLHALDKSKQDVFSISYDEQLRRFINGVLVNDELAKQIRAEFDAHIFLSYRKIDIKSAEKFMDKVHSDPKFRDVAIWFDNFLTPGEDYEENIEKAIEDCDIFSLVVTPNIYKPNAEGNTNYVMAKEYPDARNKYQKAIMPADMESLNATDKKELYEKISDLPDLVHKDKISDKISEMLLSHTKHENDTDPRHNYLIGMAYLNGIDVEKRTDIAKEMIKQSAEQHYPEAMAKIVEMYRNGIGFERDYDEAIKWQERLVAVTENGYKERPTEKNCVALYKALIYSVDLHNAMLNKENALVQCKYAIEVCNEFLCKNKQLNQKNRQIILYNMAVGYERLGDIHKTRLASRIDDPNECYKRAAEILEHIIKKANSIPVKRSLMLCYSKMGAVMNPINKYLGPIEDYDKGLALAVEIENETASEESMRDLSINYDRIGYAYKKQFNMEKAYVFFKKALDIKLQILDQWPSIQAHRDVARSYDYLSLCLPPLGRSEEAESYAKKTFEIKEYLVEKEDSIESLIDLADSYRTLYTLCRKKDEAVMFQKKAIDISARIAHGKPTSETRQQLCRDYKYLAFAYEKNGMNEAAKEYYGKAVELAQIINDEANTIDSEIELAFLCNSFAGLSHGEERIRYADIAYRIFSRLDDKYPNDIVFERGLETSKALLHQT